MKIGRFEQAGGRSFFGEIIEDRVFMLQGIPYERVDRSGEVLKLADLKPLAPVSPPNIIALGLNYRRHAEETGMPLPPRPLVFLKATTSLTDPGADILLPREAPDEVDYEAELALVIGRRAKHVSESEALDYVFGCTCANDVSARDCQKRLDKQWARAKSFDTFCPLGPWIETDLAPENLPVSLRLNGNVMQDSNTSDLIFNCAYLVSYLSRCMTLLPGTVILTGTPEGVGMAREPNVYLRPGDVVEVSIGGIGVLRNQVRAETV